MSNKFIAFLLITALAGTSCKKDHGDNSPAPPGAETAEDRLMDSVYLFSKEVYFWNDVLPAYEQFNPRQYKGSSQLSSAENVMEAIRGREPKDRFSFVTSIEESNGIQSGEASDFGYFIKGASIDVAAPVDSIFWFVNYVYDKSTAGIAGVQRGWIVNKINGTQLQYNQASADILNNTFFGSASSASFEFKQPSGDVKTISLSKTNFAANSVLYRNVINSGGKKVGYLVFNQFFGQPSRTELANVFTYFQSQGINDLVVDLRYNRGGSTETQDTLANLIAPSSADSKKMYTYEFNANLQQGNFPLLKTKPGFQSVSFKADQNTVNYSKAGSLNLSRVFFIVSNSSASASELLINNLKPYMEVKLIGDTTYGKPVGFFPIELADLAIYPISFRTINSSGNADYYNGFAPDKLTDDGVNKNWGDVTEPSLAAALRYISTGLFNKMPENKAAKLRMDVQQQLKPVQKKLEDRKFSGMFRE
jgi:C-terminal processing protease CtpA/Prc